MCERVRRLAVVAVALWLVAGLSVAPAAATATDDGLLGGDLSSGDDDLLEDGVSVGGDDGVSVGVDDGVDVTVAGEDDGVDVGVGGDEGLEASAAGESVTDGAPTSVTSQVESIGGDTAPGGVGDAPLPESDDSLPSTGPGEGVDLSETTGVAVCDLARLNSNELPTGSLPGLDALPADLAPPGVPTNLLTTETVVGLATGGVPGACEVVDLQDPQLDPTDPPTDPGYGVDILRMERTGQGAALWISTAGTLDESGDGPSVASSPEAMVETDNLDLEPDLVFDVGAGSYGTDPVVERTDDDVRLRGVVILVGKNAGVDAACTDLREVDGDLSEEALADLGPCEYQLVGIPSLFTPEDLFQVLDSAGSGGAPVDPGSLPVDPDDLLGL